MVLSESLPEFRLKGTDLNWYSSSNFDSGSVIVVIFTCNHCPYARAYVRRIAKFVQKYKSQEVTILAINPNDDKKYPADSFEHMIPMAKELGLNGLYLRDEDQAVAKAFAAERTPEVFVFDEKNKLAYHGAIDDNYEFEDQVSEHYLENAVDALLSGSKVEISETQAVGCSIKWK